MKTKKLTILAALLLCLTTSNLFAKETVTIKVYGEDYVTDMPEDIEAAQKLIRYMARMINTSDDQIVAAESNAAEERAKYLKMINELESKLDDAQKNVDEANEKLNKIDKDVDKLLKINTRFTPFFALGPVLGSDLNTGLHIELGSLFRIFGNFQIGANIFTSVYNKTSRNFDIGAGLVLAYSVN